jgi:hypothetical protein
MLLEQFLYTSFSNVGFQLLASQGINDLVQQELLSKIVQQHWDHYNPPSRHYRAIYLHQTSPQGCLFGWLYNIGQDDLDRHHTPYFVGHYLPSISLNSTLLELIFAFLTKGPAFNPIANLDLQTTKNLQRQNLPDLWFYQPLRPGLMVSDTERHRCHAALLEGQRATMFTCISEKHEQVAELDETICEALTNALTKHLGPIAQIIVWQALEEAIPIMDPHQRAQWIMGKLSSELLDVSVKKAFCQELETILYGRSASPQTPLKNPQRSSFGWTQLIQPDNQTSYGSI